MSEFFVNSFQVPNALIDAQMSSMSGNAFKCLMYVIRQTRGWHKKEDAIAVSAFVQKCGMSKNTAITSIKELVGLGLIKQVRGSASTALNNYSLTNIFDSGLVESPSAKIEPVQILHGANIESPSANSAPPSAKIAPVASANSAPTKDILFKDTLQKTLTKDTVEESGCDAFNAFYKKYPKKVAKAEAKKAFEKLKPTARLLQAMSDALDWQMASPGWLKNDGQFVPNPATWLNRRQWEDEMPASAQKVAEESLEDYVRKIYESEGDVNEQRQTLLG